jgi:putative ABC transport system permease protein
MRRFLVELRESFLMALSAVGSHKLRSGLTLLGVLIGVFSIILVMTAMRAMQNKVEKGLGELGSRTFAIQKMPGVFFGGPEGIIKYLRRKDITISQATQLKGKLTLPEQVGIFASFSVGDISSRYGQTPPNISIEGVTPGVFGASNWTILEGRPLTDAEVDAARDVCVLTSGVAKALFPFGSALGQRIKIAAISYHVVGVFEPVNAGEDARGMVVIPITTGLNRYGRQRDLAILVQARDAGTFADAMEEARGVLRAIRKVAPGEEDDFEMFTSDSLIQQFEKVTFAVRAGLALVSSIALLAAGVGIMNIMLVSVTERTREIGIRRAIGARKRSIMFQFIMEAIVLCEIGGVLGIILGVIGANALAIYLLKLPPAFPVDWALIGLGICSLIGILFGSYPAFKAAHLDPIESLRYE